MNPKILPITKARDMLNQIGNDILQNKTHYIIEKEGKPAIAMIPANEYYSLLEGLYVITNTSFVRDKQAPSYTSITDKLYGAAKSKATKQIDWKEEEELAKDEHAKQASLR